MQQEPEARAPQGAGLRIFIPACLPVRQTTPVRSSAMEELAALFSHSIASIHVGHGLAVTAGAAGW